MDVFWILTSCQNLSCYNYCTLVFINFFYHLTGRIITVGNYYFGGCCKFLVIDTSNSDVYCILHAASVFCGHITKYQETGSYQ